jgi:hypothetical protein
MSFRVIRRIGDGLCGSNSWKLQSESTTAGTMGSAAAYRPFALFVGARTAIFRMSIGGA